ncbi:MAG: adenylosuccinate lyase, partial [Bacteroidota bacterium]
MLTAISPIDGRYYSKTKALSDYFSEFALIKYRVHVELQYLTALKEDVELPELEGLDIEKLKEELADFSLEDAQKIKAIEKRTNHDVKAVEYFIKDKMINLGMQKHQEFVHFALTSQDINNTAIPLSLKDAMQNIYLPLFSDLKQQMKMLAVEWEEIPMLARTHGQAASPTTVGKEMQVFVKRLEQQLKQLDTLPYSAKFGGATGSMNAHYVAYPDIDWHPFAERFVKNYLQLDRSYPTTQIEHYDNLAAIFHACSRINTILIDFCRDVWTYISMDYFKQKVIAGEVGSSTMPHKVNPIDFENAEGNLGIANAIFTHLAQKLPISRLQRDLTDSTVLRNIGTPFAHTLIAFQSIQKGLGKLILNRTKLEEDLNKNWAVVAEAIQTVLRKKGYPRAYETLKALTRNNQTINQKNIYNFIDTLSLDNETKTYLKSISIFLIDRLIVPCQCFEGLVSSWIAFF